VPHAGFSPLRRWGASRRVFTSNVDGQFQRAGFAEVAEVHGSIHHLRCVEPCTDDLWAADGPTVTVDRDDARPGPVAHLPELRRTGAT
jgi:NAD-dependent SIR2 family protein deacetylase